MARPAGPLRAVVAEHHGYRQRGVPRPPHRPALAVADPDLHPRRAAARRPRHPDPRQAPGDYGALLGGLHTTPAVIEHGGAQSGIQLQVSPLGARALLGLPAGELAGLDLPAADVLGRLGADLAEQLQATCSWDARFRLLDERLGRLLDPDRAGPPPEVRRAWQVLHASGGTARIADVAGEVGWSERHLAARFRTEIGLTPKAAARVVRFDRARRMLPRTPAAVVAATCGYADQAHLVREFVAFTGLGRARGSPRRSEIFKTSARPRPETGRHERQDTSSERLAHVPRRRRPRVDPLPRRRRRLRGDRRVRRGRRRPPRRAVVAAGRRRHARVRAARRHQPRDGADRAGPVQRLRRDRRARRAVRASGRPVRR